MKRTISKKKIRERRLLREHCGVFNDDDEGTAPLGWCEIQRDDAAGFFDNDAAAALAVALAGGAEGTAMFYEPDSGIIEPVPVDGTDISAERWGEIELAARTILGEGDPNECAPGDLRWICIVPRVVAKAAGLLR